MKINYPKTVDTDIKKLAYLYRMQELLRLEHNCKGADFKSKKINKSQFDNYIENTFMKHQWLITGEIMKYHDKMKNDELNEASLSQISG